MTTKINKDNFDIDNTQISPVVSNVLVTDSTYANIISANGYVSNSGGYIVINGGVFGNSTRVLIDTNTPATSVTTASPTQIKIQIPGNLDSRSYALTIINRTSGNASIFPAALTVSGIDVWGNGYILPSSTVDGNVFVNLAANVDANVTYAIAAGSKVPSNLTLEANGLLTGAPNIAATYLFKVLATDENSLTANRSFYLKIL